ncbi:hypothetical protein DFH09DRAFT_1100650 [Mycena vulgaris]|nr:hypothetical protein DFH09DRAFT_1100650 [Mycena vulgaris]
MSHASSDGLSSQREGLYESGADDKAYLWTVMPGARRADRGALMLRVRLIVRVVGSARGASGWALRTTRGVGGVETIAPSAREFGARIRRENSAREFGIENIEKKRAQHPRGLAADGAPPRVMAYYKIRPDFTVTLPSDITQDLDIQIVDVSQPGAPTTMYVNVYNDSKQARPAIERLMTLTFPTDRPVILLGDWNLHHKLWSRAEDGSPSVIGLTFVNGAAITQDTVKDWTIDDTTSFGSDHKGIHWVIDHGRRELDNIAGVRYNLKDVEPNDWGAAFRETIEHHRAGIDPIMDHERPVTDDQLEAAAAAITAAIQEATAKVAKVRKPNANAKPWWDGEMKAAADNLTSFGRHRGLRAKAKKAANFFKRLCKAKKAKWAIGKLEEARTEERKDDYEFQDATITEVREAIFEASANTTPGHSQITYRVLRWAWQDASAEITP